MYINKALALYHTYCPVNRNYPDQIHTITKALQLDNSSLVAILILYINRQHDFNLEKHQHHFNDQIIYLVNYINKLSTTHDKPYDEQYIHFNKLLLTINAKLQETAVLTSLVPLLHKVSIFNLEYNDTDANHISKIISNCYIPYLLSYTRHNKLAYLLQDLCFKIQYPEERNRILHYMNWLYPDIDNIIHNIDTQFSNIFRKLNIKANLSYRIKSPYSIWVKTLVKDIHITALNDILAFRAIVPNKKSCYDFAKLIHLHYKTITSQFVDYIRYPKNNGYQSIHLVISGGSNKGNIEFQIRSTTMHRQTQYGSTHHTYKVNKYYVSRTKNNVNIIICNITLNYSNRILNVDISIVTITSKIINNVSTYNTFASFNYNQHSTHFVINNAATCTLSQTTTPEYITYYNNDSSLFIKDINSNIIDYHFALNINRNVSNILEYKVIPPVLVHIGSNSILLENNSVVIHITYKSTLYEDAFPVTKTYTKRHEDVNIRTIFESSSPKTDIATTICNISSDLLNNQDIAAQYSQQNFWLNTSNTTKDRILDLILYPANIQNKIDNISQFDKDTLLKYASQFGCLELVPLLIDHGANPCANDNNGKSILHNAMSSDNIELVSLLIEYGADVNAKTKHGETILHSAIISGNIELVYWLLYYGVNANASTEHGETILHYAVRYSNIELVSLLIEYGADVNAKTKHGGTILRYAVCDGNLELVHVLIEYGADVNAKTEHGGTILHSAVMSGHMELVHVLIEYGADVNAKTEHGETILHFAIRYDNIELISLLINHGVNINTEIHSGKTILHYTVISGNIELVSWLIDHGANVNAKTKHGETILHFAVMSGNIELVSWLIDHGANVNAKTKHGETILHFAVMSGNIALMSWLIDFGADVNAKTKHGETILHYAMWHDNRELAHWLIDFGADVNAKTEHGETILHSAVMSGHMELAHWLIDFGADVNAKTKHGETILHFAIVRDNVDLVCMLIAKGAEINVKTINNKTLLDSALEYNHFDIVKILIQCGIKIEPDTYNSICYNDLFRYLEYTNTTPQQSMLENDQTYDLQQYKQNTSVDLKTDKILNPAPESSDIHNLSSNICMDITPLSVDKLKCNITDIPKSIDDTERPLHTLEQKVQFYTGTPYYHCYSYKEYYQLGSMEYNSYQYQNATLYYDYAINIINNTNYAEYHDKEKYYIIKLLGNIYVDQGNALCMQRKYDAGMMYYHLALSTYHQLMGQDNIEFLIVLAQYNIGSAMLDQAIEKYKQGDDVMAQEYYNQGLEWYKPAEQYGLCNVDELQKETRGYLNNETISNNYISNCNYSNTDILYNSMLGEIMVST